jgi:hypothetical protein
VLQRSEQRRDRRLVELATQPARSLICIAHASAMLTPVDLEDRAPSLSRVPSHSGQVVKVTGALDERADVRLHRVDVLGQERLLDDGISPE